MFLVTFPSSFLLSVTGKFLRLYCTTYVVKINLIGMQCDRRFYH